MNDRLLVSNVQRFCLHDGPGIRTTVFLKGCTLRCPWCSNPENINPTIEYGAIDNKIQLYGEYRTPDDLFKHIMKDFQFYEHDGGVSFSGGEPLLQINNLEPLLIKLKNAGVRICFETALFVPENAVQKALKYADLMIIDVKLLSEDKCKNFIGGNIQTYFRNMDIIRDGCSDYSFRIPMIGGYVDAEDNLELIREFVGKFSPQRVEILKQHSLGNRKYRSLGRSEPIVNPVHEEKIEVFKFNLMQQVKCDVKICQI